MEAKTVDLTPHKCGAECAILRHHSADCDARWQARLRPTPVHGTVIPDGEAMFQAREANLIRCAHVLGMLVARIDATVGAYSLMDLERTTTMQEAREALQERERCAVAISNAVKALPVQKPQSGACPGCGSLGPGLDADEDGDIVCGSCGCILGSVLWEDEDCCECGATIPNEPGGGLANQHHEETCSLFQGGAA